MLTNILLGILCAVLISGLIWISLLPIDDNSPMP